MRLIRGTPWVATVHSTRTALNGLAYCPAVVSHFEWRVSQEPFTRDPPLYKKGVVIPRTDHLTIQNLSNFLLFSLTFRRTKPSFPLLSSSPFTKLKRASSFKALETTVPTKLLPAQQPRSPSNPARVLNTCLTLLLGSPFLKCFLLFDRRPDGSKEKSATEECGKFVLPAG